LEEFRKGEESIGTEKGSQETPSRSGS